jgi:RNA polymerase sigma-70 factor, ECF subfamily
MMTMMRLAGQPGAQARALMDSYEDLIVRARRGDDEAFRLIFERYARPIISFIYDMVGQRELAEDLTQETFVRAYRNLGALQDDSKLSMWLFGIARNVARESLRSRYRENNKIDMDDDRVIEMSDDKPPPDGQLLNKELNGVIQKALELLDEDKRQVFTLKVFQHWSYEEIAKLTGFSIPKLKTDLHRAKAEMRRHIRSYLEMSDEL